MNRIVEAFTKPYCSVTGVDSIVIVLTMLPGIFIFYKWMTKDL